MESIRPTVIDQFPLSLRVQLRRSMRLLQQVFGGKYQVLWLVLAAVAVVAYGLWQGYQSLFFNQWPAPQTRLIVPDIAPEQTPAKQQQDFSALSQLSWVGQKQAQTQIDKEAAKALAETKLKLNLQGTILGSSPRAIVYNETERKTKVVSIGGKIAEHITLERIERRRVVLNNKGKLETLTLPAAVLPGADEVVAQRSKKHRAVSQTPQPPNGYIPMMDRPLKQRLQYTIKRSEIAQVFTSLSTLTDEIRVIPRLHNNAVEGYKVDDLNDQGFLATKLGLKQGDVLLQLNGVPVAERGKFIPMLMELRNARRAELVVNRGNNVLLQYTVE